MKTRKLVNAGLVAGMLLISGLIVNAQPGQKGDCKKNMKGQGICKFLPDVTPEQEAQIKTLKTQYLKGTQALRNDLNEKEAHYKTLMTAEKPEMNVINNLIDEIASIQGKLMRERAAHQQEVRKILTEDQRVIFDQHISLDHGGRGLCKGPAEGKIPGPGKGK